ELYGAEAEISAGKFSSEVLSDSQRKLVLLLAPFAPYLAAELWETLGEKTSLLRQPWPEYDPELAREEEIVYAVQINGKLRGHVPVPAESSGEAVQHVALTDEKVQAAIAGREIVRVIPVPGKLVNIVVK